MATTASIVAYAVGGTAVVATVLQAVTDLPWDAIKGASAAGLVLSVGWVFLRRDEVVRKEHIEASRQHNEAVKSIASDFGKTMQATIETFGETTTTLLRESRQEAAAREQQAAAREQSLHALLKDHHQTRA